MITPIVLFRSYSQIFLTSRALCALCTSFFLGVFLFPTSEAFASEPSASPSLATTKKKNTSALSQWWSGKYGTGKWWGLRPALEDRGLALLGSYRGSLYDTAYGGNSPGSQTWDQQLFFLVRYDLGKSFDALNGFLLESAGRYRDGRSIMRVAGTTGMFDPCDYQGGQGWRFISAFLTYITPELFGAPQFLTLSAGWMPAAMFFLQESRAKQFTNNVFTMPVPNIPWSGTCGTWGGYAKIKPNDVCYIQGGLFEAIPRGTSTGNHGLDFSGVTPRLRNQLGTNGLWAVGEIGATPEFTKQKLPGKFAFGTYYYGVTHRNMAGQATNGNYGFYWQADQMLYRRNALTPPPLTVAEESQLVRDPTASRAQKETIELQGLYFFSTLYYAPPSQNELPFLFHVGLVYQGLIPGRPLDTLGVGYAQGNYSDQIRHHGALQSGSSIYSMESVLEVNYRIALNEWLSVEPFMQTIFNPGANHSVSNCIVIGFGMQAAF